MHAASGWPDTQAGLFSFCIQFRPDCLEYRNGFFESCPYSTRDTVLLPELLAKALPRNQSFRLCREATPVKKNEMVLKLRLLLGGLQQLKRHRNVVLQYLFEDSFSEAEPKSRGVKI